MKFKVVPIPDEIAATAREKMISPQYKSLAAAVSLANGYGPCRSCLRTFREGKEDRIYITYNSAEGVAELPSPGPIFLHADGCEPFNGKGFPIELRELPMLFEGFGENSQLVNRTKAEESAIEAQIDTILAMPDVKYINIRNAEAGCFIARIERS